MKTIFFGTPDYVLPIVKALPNLLAVVTREPKPAGRQGFISRSPVDNWAYKRKIPVIYDLSQENLPPADLGVLAAYSRIIPEAVIKHFKYGILNIHPSLLPQFRGASPVQATLLTESSAGVSIIKLDSLLDHGPIVSSFKEVTLADDTNETLTQRLFAKSAQFLINLLPSFIAEKIKLTPQDESQVSLTRMITREAGFIPPQVFKNALAGKEDHQKMDILFIRDYTLKANANSLERFIRALSPWPGAWTDVSPGQKRLKILKAHVEQLTSGVARLVPDLVQLEGKKPVTWSEFIQGYPRVEFTTE